MFDLNLMRIFVSVVERKGIRTAADELGIPKSNVSRGLIELEAHLGVRLIERSTRSSQITDAGSEYYRHCRKILDEISLANGSIQGKQQQFRGQIRLSVHPRLGTDFFHELAIKFARIHPEATLILTFSDQAVNLIDDRFDLRVCLEPPGPDSSIVSRQIATLSSGLYASSSYLLRYGTPTHPSDLEAHQLLASGKNSQPVLWRFKKEEQTIAVRVSPRLQSSSDEMLIKWSQSGLGICLIHDLMVDKSQTGLIRVLNQWSPPPTEVRVSFVSRKSVTPLIRSVLDILASFAREYCDERVAPPRSLAKA